MKDRSIGLILGVLVFSTVLLAQGPTPSTAPQPGAAGAKAMPRTPDGKPDLSGIWKTVSSKVEPVQLTAWGTKRFNYNKLPEGDGARTELDPINHCYRPGLLRIGPPLLVPAKSIRVRIEGESVPLPGDPSGFDVIEIRYAPRKVWVIYQYNQESRQIFTDGRKHPAVVEDDLLTRSWNGHSTGSWDGDVFVVDTANLREETWLDNLGHEMSGQAQIVERFRRVDAETLEIERTITDPNSLAKPYMTRATLKLSPNVTFQENVICDQYYGRKIAFGFEGILGISDHPWQSPEEDPNATWDGSNSTPDAKEDEGLRDPFRDR